MPDKWICMDCGSDKIKRLTQEGGSHDRAKDFFNYVTKMSITDGWQTPTIALLKALREQVKGGEG